MKSGVNRYPYWPPDFRQNPFSLPARGIGSAVAQMPINQTPLMFTRQRDIRVIVAPLVKQDTSRVGQSDKQTKGVGNPGGLLDRLNAGVEKQRGTK